MPATTSIVSKTSPGPSFDVQKCHLWSYVLYCSLHTVVHRASSNLIHKQLVLMDNYPELSDVGSVRFRPTVRDWS
jgi:hypothetical protein